MKKILSIVVLFFAINGFGVVQIGEVAPNLCYSDIDQQQFCLEELRGRVAVLVYNAGWCPPCNAEMAQLAPASAQFANLPVALVSLSAAGWNHGSDPDVQFLQEWKDKHNIPDKDSSGVNFIIASSPGDYGKHFIAPPLYIPNVSILDQDGVLVDKEVGMSGDKIVATVRRLLAESPLD